MQATAILTTGIDSTAVLQELAKMKNEFFSFAKPIIVPQMDIKPALAKVSQLSKEIVAKISSAAATVVPKVDTSGIDVAPIQNAVSGAVDTFQVLEQSVKNIKASLAKNTSGGNYSQKKLESLRKTMLATTNSTANLRLNIRQAFKDIEQKAKGLGVATDSLEKMKSKMSALTSGTGILGKFRGQASKKAIVAGMKEYEVALTTAYSSLQAKIKSMSGAKEVSIASPKVKVEPVAKAFDYTAVKAWLNEGWIDFAKRYEWTQGRKAIVAEAEAAFSRESVMRKILGALFNFSAEAGGSGYFIGKALETIAGVTKTILRGLPSLFAAPLNYAASKTSGIFQKFFSGMGKTIKGTSLVVTGPLRAILSIFQIAINKYTIAILAATYSSINKIVFKAFAKLGKVLYSAAKGLYGRISGMIKGLFSNIFSAFSGGSGELGGISLGKLIGVGGMATAIKLAADLEQQIRNVSTITGQMGASLSAVTRKVIDISNEFGKSAIDTAKALYDISSAGFKGAKAVMVLRNSLTAARAGLTDASTASAAIARTLRAWNLEASKSSQVSDILFNVVKRGVTTFQEVAGQITRVTSVAAAAGASFDEVGAVLANLTRNGQTTTQAVLGLAQLFKSIIAPSSQAAKAAEELGLKWNEAAVRQKGFIKTVQDAAPKILQNKKVFKMLVGDVQALKSALILAKDPASLSGDLAAMQERGAAAYAAAQQAISFNEQIKKFWTNFVNILRNIGGVLLPMVQPVLEKVVEWTQKIATFTNTDFSGFATKIKQIFGSIMASVGNVVAKVLNYLYYVWEKTKNTLLAVIVGFVRAIAPVVVAAMNFVVKKIIAGFVAILKKMFWSAVHVIKEIVLTIDLLLEVGLGKIYGGIKSFVGGIITAIKRIYNVIDWIVVKIGNALAWLTGFGSASEAVTKVTKSVDKLDRSLSINKKLGEFAKNFKQGFSSIYDDKSYLDYSKSGIGNAIKGLGDNIVGAGKDLYGSTAKTLGDQANGIKILIANLTAQHKKEVAAKQKEKAAITLQFLNQEKSKLNQITKQLSKSKLDKLLERRQKLYIQLVKAQRAQNTSWQQIAMEQIKENELKMIALEREKEAKRNKILNDSKNSQIKAMETIRNKAKELVKAGQNAGQGLGKLNEALDNIFGKNIEKISKKYGVGRDIATSRTLTKDIIEAKAAGFKKEDIDTIIRRGLFSSSEAMTRLVTAFNKRGRSLSASNIDSMGLFDELVKVLDQTEAMGLSAEGREKLFGGAITKQAFQMADALKIDNKQTRFISLAMQQFATVAEERELQQRFNKAQVRLGALTKTAVTRSQQFKKTVEELEQTVAELEEKTRKANEIAVTGGAY